MRLQEIFIENLKNFRKQKGMTQMDLTIAIDKSYNYINGIEQGKSFPQIDVIEKIAEVLQINPAELFDENSIAKNIIRNNKEFLAEEIAKRIQKSICKNVEKGLKRILKSY